MACSLRMAARSLRLRLRGCGARGGAVTRLVMGRTRSVVLQQAGPLGAGVSWSNVMGRGQSRL